MAKRTEGVAAVERALSILLCFEEKDRVLSLAELTRRTELDKATVLRLARTLALDHFLVRTDDGAWRLGPALVRLGTYYQSTFSLGRAVEPILERLAQATGESAALYVREGDSRVCLFRHDSEQSIRHHVRVGSLLPLNQGAPGHVILAYSGEEGELYDQVRSNGFHHTFGERDPQVASVSVPIFSGERKLFGALAVTGPPNRFGAEAVESYLQALRFASARLTLDLGGDPTFFGPDILDQDPDLPVRVE
ncbi:IclR family transcriptional regulator [Devosia sp. BSSL-BM10]|uniref:IclR family transcriptional regulator n=1 Tax=Devosia litorisediminis TaxID=2829817 RepID=A0A942IEK2_9HYPH|nr:IclR family transcriptional regulator [Devosia litorisediminis]MBS3849774.1 IclR family transcriptional regulator [Devosia litorisediminis]